jgi:HPt (histidine-containing phosphotransfer) domain-containing protein
MGNAISKHSTAAITRQLLRTPDARKLAHELLAIFAKEASSKLASNRLLFLRYPTIDGELLQRRFEQCLAGKEIFDELQKSGNLSRARTLLSTLSLSQEKKEKEVKKIFAAGKQSDVISYFSSRRKMLEVADTFLSEEDFSHLKALNSLLLSVNGSKKKTSNSSGVDARDALIQIRKNLKEVDELGVPGAEALISDAEIAINDELRRKHGSLDRETVKQIIGNETVKVSSALGMNREEEDRLMKAVFEGLVSLSSASFEFDRHRLHGTLEVWRHRREEELAQRLEKVEDSLRGLIERTDELLERLVLLDEMLTTASLMQKYSLSIPKVHVGAAGISFKNGLNLFLLLQRGAGDDNDGATKNNNKKIASSPAVLPVNYSIGTPSTDGQVAAEPIPPRNVVMLTGANSGGKTTLLTTLASIHILSLYGLPVPCESAEVSPMPLYLFRRRMTRKIGSLEQALRSLIPVFASSSSSDRGKEKRNLILIDEFEALTEPGAAGRIIATMMNRAALGNDLVLLVTHLARETLPHIKLPIRVDGIEASGFDPTTGELVVDRQPKFGHIGSSSPQHIVNKLSKAGSAKSGVKALYAEILEALGSESSVPVQTPLFFPWMASSSEDKKSE